MHDVLELVPQALLEQSPHFLAAMKRSNDELATVQSAALHKIHSFLRVGAGAHRQRQSTSQTPLVYRSSGHTGPHAAL